MKFGDKLQNLRKASSLSQEQLADKLNVSRQAVSKWESNASYPEMDKLIAMCKLFKCSMDDLVNDEVKDKEIITKNDNQLNNYVLGFINFFIESFNMFFSMKIGTLIRTLIELFIIGLILFSGGALIIGILAEFAVHDLGVGYSTITNLIYTTIACFVFLALIIVFIQVYKNRYLNYYLREKYKNNQITNLGINDIPNDEKKVDFKSEKLDFKKDEPKFIIRDRKESSFAITLLQILTICTKAFIIVFIAPWLILGFTFLVLTLVICIYLIFYNLFFLGITIAIIGAIVITELILEFIYNFLINKKIKFKRFGIMFLCSMIAIGVGGGISLIRLGNFELKSISTIDTYEKSFKYSDNLIIDSFNSINFTIDNNVKDIQVSMSYNVDIYDIDAFIREENGEQYLNINYRLQDNLNYINYITSFFDNLKNNIILIDEYHEDNSINIKTTEENIKNLIKNMSKHNRIKVEQRGNEYYVIVIDRVNKDDICTLNKNGFYECIRVTNDGFCEYTVDEYNNVIPKDIDNCTCEKYSKYNYDCSRKSNKYFEE